MSLDPVIIIFIGAIVVLAGIIVFKLHAFIALLLAAFVTALLTTPEMLIQYGLNSGMSDQEALHLAELSIGRRIATAFGNTSGKIGILIALASIIGSALMHSGGAERIVRGMISLFGRKNTPVAFLSSSFMLGIPVFFDTIFYLMLPLIKSAGIRNPGKFGLYLMAVIAGGVMSHSLIPPTPGPLFVAEELGIDLGTMIMGGIVIGIITVSVGYFYSLWVSSKWELPLRDTPDISIEELKSMTSKDSKDLPALWISVLPVLLPILLIAGSTILKMTNTGDSGSTGGFYERLLMFFSVFGDPNIALGVSAAIALLLLWIRTKNLKLFRKYNLEAIGSAGIIILITASGGAFGQMLQQTGIGTRVAELAGNYQTAILPLAFVITAVVRTAQGSATVAMVTTVGIMSGVMNADLAFHPVYLALVIGCGSKTFAWMNDSAFWIVTKMSGMKEKETIRHFSLLLMVMGIAGLIAIMLFSKIIPLV